jgi:4-hydroxybenzoate polyprenyltransferase
MLGLLAIAYLIAFVLFGWPHPTAPWIIGACVIAVTSAIEQEIYAQRRNQRLRRRRR